MPAGLLKWSEARAECTFVPPPLQRSATPPAIAGPDDLAAEGDLKLGKVEHVGVIVSVEVERFAARQ